MLNSIMGDRVSGADGASRVTSTTKTPERQRRALGLALAFVAVGYLLLVSVFTMRTGAWENNDEADHVLYVEHVIKYGTPPSIAIGNGGEAHQAPLYYYLVAAWQKVSGIPAFNPQLVPNGDPAVPVEKKVLILSHDYSGSQLQEAEWLHTLRIVSVACGLLTVAATFATGWLLTGTVAFSTATAAAVATWPKFLVMSAAVTNSALVDALCAVAIPCWLLWFRSRSPRWASATGICLGLAVLTQVTALPIAGLMLLAMAIVALRRWDWRSPLAAGLCWLAACGWWFVHNGIVYGDSMATQATYVYLTRIFGPILIRNPPVLSGDVLRHSLPILAHSTWFDAGWNQLQLPQLLDIGIWILAAFALGAALWSRFPGRLVIVLSAMGAAVAWLLIIRQTTQAEGRYLLVAVTAWATLLVEGSARLVRWRSVGIWLWPVVFLVVDAYLIGNWLIPDGTL